MGNECISKKLIFPIFFGSQKVSFWHLSSYLIILHLLVQFDPILMQINPEIQGDANLHHPTPMIQDKNNPP